jgi:hypothetical protein
MSFLAAYSPNYEIEPLVLAQSYRNPAIGINGHNPANAVSRTFYYGDWCGPHMKMLILSTIMGSGEKVSDE